MNRRRKINDSARRPNNFSYVNTSSSDDDEYTQATQPRHVLQSLHSDIRRLVALAFPKLDHRARETIACDYFIDAFADPDFALKVYVSDRQLILIRLFASLSSWKYGRKTSTEFGMNNRSSSKEKREKLRESTHS